MICERCHGTRMADWAPCPECIGGVASCCDAAGSAEPPLSPGVQKAMDKFWQGLAQRRAEEAYRDDKFCARPCDRCGQWYRGPAVYCSLECAQEDA